MAIEADWTAVAERIREGDPDAAAELYQNLSVGPRAFLRRRLKAGDVEDRLHNVFIIVVENIRRGALREPRRLMGFIRTVLHRQLNLEISRIIETRRSRADLAVADGLHANEPTPEQLAVRREQVELMKQVLRTMTQREFEVLTRFYLHEQPPEQIRSEMKLTQTQFDLLKSRAKARLTQAMHRKLNRGLTPQ